MYVNTSYHGFQIILQEYSSYRLGDYFSDTGFEFLLKTNMYYQPVTLDSLLCFHTLNDAQEFNLNQTKAQAIWLFGSESSEFVLKIKHTWD